jgi:hypothetical protein
LPGTLYVTDVVWVLWFTGWLGMVKSTSGLYVQKMLSGILLSECDDRDGVRIWNIFISRRYDMHDMFKNMSSR